MKRMVYVVTAALAAMLVLAPVALGQDVDCPQLSFEDAQAILAQDPSDPNRLDADNDGIACDDNAPAQQPQATEQPPPESGVMEQTTMVEKTVVGEPKMQPEGTQPLPKSGGPAIGSPSLILPATALLLGSGVLAFAVLRRRT